MYTFITVEYLVLIGQLWHSKVLYLTGASSVATLYISTLTWFTDTGATFMSFKSHHRLAFLYETMQLPPFYISVMDYTENDL